MSEMKECCYCNMDIPSKARICPYCGNDPDYIGSDAHKSRKNAEKFFLIMLAFFITVACLIFAMGA
ncbi:MAG: hypothetical protein KQI81_08755 [Deltaproteobacteria bacterium]|nr:hypothetical protein [Deltaproteobacteria bacterium]